MDCWYCKRDTKEHGEGGSICTNCRDALLDYMDIGFLKEQKDIAEMAELAVLIETMKDKASKYELEESILAPNPNSKSERRLRNKKKDYPPPSGEERREEDGRCYTT